MAGDIAQPIDIVIVGGSIAGLCMGVALKGLPQVKSITILERYGRDQLQDQGAGLRVAGEVSDFFSKYANVTQHEIGLSVDKFVALDAQGGIALERPITGSCSTTWIHLFRVLQLAFVKEHRGDQATTCQYRYDSRLESIMEYGKQVKVDFQNSIGEHEILVADLVIGADGASSKVRHILLPDVERKYVGYVLLRGLAPVKDLSAETRKVTDYAMTVAYNRSQVISYEVPARSDGPPDERKDLNWGWYDEKSVEELKDLMTGRNGRHYQFALPPGQMQEQFADNIRARAQKELDPRTAEVIAKTKTPFVQVITDAETPRNMFWNGRVLLVGDAAGGQRPHTGSAVTAACFHAHLLRLHLLGQMSLEKWSEDSHFVSDILFRGGRDIGDIIMSESLGPGDKARQAVSTLSGCLEQVAKTWKPYPIEVSRVANGDAK